MRIPDTDDSVVDCRLAPRRPPAPPTAPRRADAAQVLAAQRRAEGKEPPTRTVVARVVSDRERTVAAHDGVVHDDLRHPRKHRLALERGVDPIIVRPNRRPALRRQRSRGDQDERDDVRAKKRAHRFLPIRVGGAKYDPPRRPQVASTPPILLPTPRPHDTSLPKPNQQDEPPTRSVAVPKPARVRRAHAPSPPS